MEQPKFGLTDLRDQAARMLTNPDDNSLDLVELFLITGSLDYASHALKSDGFAELAENIQRLRAKVDRMSRVSNISVIPF